MTTPLTPPNAIESVEVVGSAAATDGRTLRVRCRLPLPTDLDATGLRIVGGLTGAVRVRRAIRADQVGPVYDDREPERALQIETDDGGAATHRLLIVDPDRYGFDPDRATATFTFGAGGHGAAPSVVLPEPTAAPHPHPDYLSRDYAGFRTAMLDRLSVLVPGWTDRGPADLAVTLVELFAHVGDQLSYAQDAVATEAYLGTARHRISVRRHARLLNYRVHEGAAARTWLVFTADAAADGLELPAGTEVGTGAADDPGTDTVFHTLAPVTVRSARNALAVLGADGLRAGARAALVARADENSDAERLRAGEVLLFDDGTHRWPVRLDRAPAPTAGGWRVSWAAADAPPLPLVGAVAHANVVPAEHGAAVGPEPLVPAVVPVDGPYRPRLARPGLAHTGPYAPDGPAAAVTADGPTAPALTVRDDVREWTVVADLLDSDRFDHHCVVEVDDGGDAHLRFGDGVHGRTPEPGTTFTATYRLGGGRSGNVGAGVLTDPRPPRHGLAVTNPLVATGGREPEPVERVRRWAPVAHRDALRAVTDTDWVDAAERHPEVRQAHCVRRWTGTRSIAVVTVDRSRGRAVDLEFLAAVTAHLEPFRTLGGDLEVVAAVPVPLAITLSVTLTEPRLRTRVRSGLRAVFAVLFAPDRFGLGEDVFLSRVIAAAMTVPGVAAVDWPRFGRYGHPPAGEADAGRIPIGPTEVARCASDPDRPDLGTIDLTFVEVAGAVR